MRFAHPAPAAHGWHIWAEHFKKSVEDKTGGKIQVQIFPNAQMGNERDTAQAVRIGSLEMGAIGVGLMNWVPEMSVTDAPFLWKSRAQAGNAIDGAFGDDLRKRSLDKGFVLLGWTDLGFRSMTNNKHPINSAKDMQGLKMRVPNSKAYIAMMQATGRLDRRRRPERAVPRAEPRRRRRPGHAALGGQVEQVLRGAEVHLARPTISSPWPTRSSTRNSSTAFTPTRRRRSWPRAATPTIFLAPIHAQGRGRSLRVPQGPGHAGEPDVDVESFRVACAPVIEKYPDLFLPELVKTRAEHSSADSATQACRGQRHWNPQ